LLLMLLSIIALINYLSIPQVIFLSINHMVNGE